jgi:hypothetical protein
MAGITLGSDVQLDDPRLKAIGTRIVDTVRLAGEKAVANAIDAKRYPLTKDPASYERMLRARYDNRPEAVRLAARAKVQASLKASPAQRAKSFGALAKLDLHTDVPIEDLAATVDGLPRLTLAKPVAAAASGAAAATPTNRTLALRVRRVVCLDETNGLFGSEAGNDEIVLGATTVDETGDTHTVKKFGVGDFDDGDVKRYSPPRQVTWFNVLEGASYPKSYYVTVVLAEEDMGGTAEFLNKLADKLESEIRQALVKAGAELGGAIGAVIGLVLGWVVGKIFDWFAEVWGDEIFKPRTVRVTLSSPTTTFGGKLVSPAATLKFKGHGGEYAMDYDWVIAR